MPHNYKMEFRDGYYFYECTQCEHWEMQLSPMDAPNPNEKVYDFSTERFMDCAEMEATNAAREVHAS